VHRIDVECCQSYWLHFFVHQAAAYAIDHTSMAGAEAQLFVFFIMVVAAAEVTVGLAIIVMLYRNIHSVDINFLNRLKH